MMEKMRVSAVSMGSTVNDIGGNLRRMLAYAGKASEAGSDLVLFPEMCLTGYSTEVSPGMAMGFDDPSVGSVIDASSDLDISICFGFPETGPYITQAVAESGKIIGSYRKTHLGGREAPVFSAGDSFPIIKTRKAAVGIQTCWESHFPQISASYAYQGADLILMPHASGLGGDRRRDSWNKVIPARAYDNTVFAVACNMYGDNGTGTVFGGGTAAYDERGNLLGECYDGENMLTVDLDPGNMERIRRGGQESMRYLYFLDRSRPDIYVDRYVG